ncbi:hypothetical protein MtrunA17_Chr6g0457721 [Medicago truncatula]|uniref:Uncharacterized protein n=1 Tax=Medicago truncatula TaxID=3880 RepID=A0A396HAY5_MEDTR|nr:hypothetical protein MtrunA17_Chr6g0457721 [Medicago truncatula]
MQRCHPLRLVMNLDIICFQILNRQELSSIVFDPNSVSRVREDARIPGIVHEIRRLADLELSIVKSIPRGFNSLRYIYEDIVEENVAAGIYDSQARDQSTSSETNAGSSLPNTTPLPNP